jgi:hypothetical protein
MKQEKKPLTEEQKNKTAVFVKDFYSKILDDILKLWYHNNIKLNDNLKE